MPLFLVNLLRFLIKQFKCTQIIVYLYPKLILHKCQNAIITIYPSTAWTRTSENDLSIKLKQQQQQKNNNTQLHLHFWNLSSGDGEYIRSVCGVDSWTIK